MSEPQVVNNTHALPGCPDDELMALVQQDRQDAFAELIQRYQPYVWGTASRYLGSRTEGRDVAQDVFLYLWESRGKYESRGKFKSYLLTLTLHRCKYAARSRKNLKKKHDNFHLGVPQDEPAERPVSDQLEDREEILRVREKLQDLPEKMRKVVVLRYLDELGYEEIADITGYPVGTVKSYVFRGLAAIQQLLGS